MIANLVANFAVVGLFAALWINAHDWVVAQKPRTASVLFGLVMGLAALVSIVISYKVDGFLIDLRAVPIALAALFGGPIAGAIAAALVVVGRIAVGGPGVVPGSLSIVLAMVAGLGGWLLLLVPRFNRVLALALVAGATGARTILIYPLLPATMQASFWPDLWPAMLTSAVGVAMIGLAMFIGRDRAHERVLLRGAIAQAPDYFYVKDTRSRIVAANKHVAEAHGYSRPDEMKGLTDYDLEPEERAAELAATETSMMMSGRPINDTAETVTGKDGMTRAFVTSKVPVYSGSGELVGLVGVTKDMTSLQKLQKELTDSRNQLAVVLAEMSDGVALLDPRGYFLLTNEQYRSFFPKTGHLRVAGAFLPAVLQAVIDTGEQPAVTSANAKEWMANVMASLRNGGDQLIQTDDGRWLQMRTRVNNQGTSVAVVSDITSIKRAEMDLLAATKQLEVLSITDGLTQLTNRRGFDEGLKREFGRSKRTDKPLSVILLDIDRFKSFNDRYGHLEGDEALRLVGSAAQRALRRPSDVVARYGGEELALILPDTTLQGAYQVAEAVRSEIRALNIVHEASEKGFVTASLGVAAADPLDPLMSERLLLARADEALYSAKESGRDRVVAWSDPHLDLNEVPYRPVA